LHSEASRSRWSGRPGLGAGSDSPSASPEGPAAESEECPVADVLYALLLVGGFAVLALCLRGLERL
jgi:hypothetical protein